MNMVQCTACAFVFSAQILLVCSGAHTRTWYVKADGTGDVPLLQGAIDSAAVGDTVLVGPGRYTWSNQGTGDERGFIRFLRDRHSFTFRSETGAEATILDAEYQCRTIYLQGMNDLVIEGFTVTRGEAPDFGDRFGGGLFTHISNDVVRDCIFTGNRAEIGAGLNCAGGGSSMLVENCTFTGNVSSRYGGGVGFTGSLSVGSILSGCVVTSNEAAKAGGGVIVYGNLITIENCIIAGNYAHESGGGIGGIQVLSPSIVRGCTITENSSPNGAGIHLDESSVLSLYNCIIAFNTGKGLSFETGFHAYLGCNDLFGNSGGNALPLGCVNKGGNIFLDPQFCGERGSGNYYLQSDSPCIAENHPQPWYECETIGARSAGCGTIGTAKRSWSRIKGLHAK